MISKTSSKTLELKSNLPEILLVDDNTNLCQAIEKYVSFNEQARVSSSSNEKNALLKLEKASGIILILVDLRLEKGEKGKDAGLRLIEEMAKRQKEIPLVLFTSNVYDPIIQTRIEQTINQYPNFVLAKEKTEPQQLQQLIHYYLEKTKQEKNQNILSLISSSLREKLDAIGKKVQKNRNKQHYEEGKLLYEAREAINNRRTELKTLIEQNPTETLRQELTALSGAWAAWLSQYIDMSERTILYYTEYYLYFSDPKRFPHQEKFNLAAQQALTKGQKTGRNSEPILSEQEQQFLLEQPNPPNAKQITKYRRIRQRLSTLPTEIVFELSKESLVVIDNLLSRLQGNISDLKLIEQQLCLTQKEIMSQKFAPDNSSKPHQSPSDLKYQRHGCYIEVQGDYQTLIEQLKSQNQTITALMLDLNLITAQIVSLVKRENIQLITLPMIQQSELGINLSYLLLSSYITNLKIIIIVRENKEKIQAIFQDWQKQLSSFAKEDPDFFNLLNELKKNDDLYLLSS